MGRERGGYLLTAGEVAVLDRIASLEGEPARLYARLTARRPRVFELETLTCPDVPDVEHAASTLVEAELADHLVPWDRRAEALTVADLKQALRGLGLRVGGRRAELVDRLRGHTDWRPGAWLRIRHRKLIRRLESWYFLRAWADRSTLVVERIGHIRWPKYKLTAGDGLFRDRRALLAWEALRAPDLTVDVALSALASGAHRAPGRLNLGYQLGRDLVEIGRELESSDPAAARALYLEIGRHLSLAGFLAPRVARTLEAQSNRADALAHLRRIRPGLNGVERLVVNRAGKRLARSLRRGWAPDPPLQKPPVRSLRLPAGTRRGPRPRYRIDSSDLIVEEAIRAKLLGSGRRSIHAEGTIWSTLFALLFAECYFLDVPGALPVRFLSGPLDLGTPAFRARRAPAVQTVLAAVTDGEAPARIRAADDRYRGVQLRGASWDIADRETLAEVAQGMGPTGLRAILERILGGGRRATRGLPDLVILPGESCLPHAAFPHRLGAGLPPV